MWVKQGLFEPPGLKRDMLLIGPGTGLASMRAMVQERQYLCKQASGASSGVMYLYFGCRHESKVVEVAIPAAWDCNHFLTTA